MTRDLTTEERRWIARLRRVAKEQPSTLRVIAGMSVLAVYTDRAEDDQKVDAFTAPGFWPSP